MEPGTAKNEGVTVSQLRFKLMKSLTRPTEDDEQASLKECTLDGDRALRRQVATPDRDTHDDVLGG
jgi:hypothetical protein